MVNAQGKRWVDTNAKGTEVINSLRSLNYQPYEFEGGGPYLGFPRSHDVWGDDSVVIVPAPGHTPDSVVVFVNLPSGTRYALVGAAAGLTMVHFGDEDWARAGLRDGELRCRLG
jgi:glyoxylase-like metal-dependent hydrolase (beta-lactamase superfamily II)